MGSFKVLSAKIEDYEETGEFRFATEGEFHRGIDYPNSVYQAERSRSKGKRKILRKKSYLSDPMAPSQVMVDQPQEFIYEYDT